MLVNDGILVDPVKSARDPGIYIDSNLLMRAHVQRTVPRCFAVFTACYVNYTTDPSLGPD